MIISLLNLMFLVSFKSESLEKKITKYSCMNDSLNFPGFNLSALWVALIISSGCKAPGFRMLMQVYLKYPPLTKDHCQREDLMCDQALSCLQQQLNVTAPNVGLGRISPRAILPPLLCSVLSLSGLINLPRRKFQLEECILYLKSNQAGGRGDAVVQAGSGEEGPLPWKDPGDSCAQCHQRVDSNRTDWQCLGQNVPASKHRASLIVRVKDRVNSGNVLENKTMTAPKWQSQGWYLRHS